METHPRYLVRSEPLLQAGLSTLMEIHFRNPLPVRLDALQERLRYVYLSVIYNDERLVSRPIGLKIYV